MKNLGKILTILLLLGVATPSGWAQQSLDDDPGFPLPGQIPRITERGLPFPSEHFAPPDYQQYPQNWAVTQDHRGLIYVANNDGILEYDGDSWRLIPTTTNTFVRSIAASEEGTIYAGTVGDFGYLKPDSIGVLRYASLYEHVPPLHESFSDVWGTHATSDGVYFQANERLFRWDGSNMRVWTSDEGFHTSFVVRDELYVRDFQRGLLKMVGDSLQQMPAGERFMDTPVHLMVPFPDGQILIGTSKDGLYLYDGQRLTPFSTEAQPFLEEYELYHGCLLSGGHVALATIGGGVLIIDREGRLVRVLGPSSELPDGVVHYVYEDQEGGLWMAFSNSGVARAEVVSPLSTYDESLGLEGIIQSIERHQERLYVATGAGLFVLEEQPLTLRRRGNGKRTAFRRVEGIPVSWDLRSTGEGLLVATEKGIYLRQENGWERLTQGTQHTARTIVASDRYDGWYFVGGRQGVTALHRDGDSWTTRILPGIGREIHSIDEDQQGALWVSTPNGDVYRVRFQGSPGAASHTTHFKSGGALPQGYNSVMSVAGDVVLLSRSGIYRVEQRPGRSAGQPGEEADSVRFVRDGRMRPQQTEDPLLSLFEADDGALWMSRGSQVYRGVRQADGGYRWESVEALHFPKAEENPLYVEDSGVLWMGNRRELIRFEPRWGTTSQGTFPVLVRRVTALQDQTVLYGGGPRDASVARSGEFLWDQIPYGNNDLRFDFSAPRFGNTASLEYQYRLQGLDADWSAWQSNTNVVYSDLAEGSYTFQVRAREGKGRISQEATFSFGILPPWYRTWWAYGVYLVVLGLTGLGYRRYRYMAQQSRRAKEQAKELERERLANERLQEANKRLKQANELKDNFLANTSHELRTPLTTILGFADVLKDEASPHHREFLDIIEKSGQRLLRTLNALLDLAKLRSGVVTAQLQRTNVINKVTETLELMEHEAHRKGLQLELDVPEHPVYAKLDERFYEQVVDNLISNAIKFTEDGYVRVHVEQAADRVQVSVQDTGVGIDEDFIPSLFDDFKQESSGISRDHEGNGLGLAITARLVELMHGTIDVESTKGRGSTFTVTFPRDTEVGDVQPSSAEAASPK